jgi:hypothetical protein
MTELKPLSLKPLSLTYPTGKTRKKITQKGKAEAYLLLATRNTSRKP